MSIIASNLLRLLFDEAAEALTFETRFRKIQEACSDLRTICNLVKPSIENNMVPFFYWTKLALSFEAFTGISPGLKSFREFVDEDEVIALARIYESNRQQIVLQENPDFRFDNPIEGTFKKHLDGSIIPINHEEKHPRIMMRGTFPEYDAIDLYKRFHFVISSYRW